MKKKKPNQQSAGQIIIIVLLVMVVILVIALSTIGRSITEISTATKTEESSRAFSAAEAGIEQTLGSGVSSGSVTVNSLTNNAQATVNWNANLPQSTMALEYPTFGKESYAQFWLANPATLAMSYNEGTFQLYFGKARDYTLDLDNKPAVEVHVIVKSQVSNSYYDKRYFYDSSNAAGRATGNGFNYVSNCSSAGVAVRTNDNTKDSSFYCQATVPPTGNYRENAADTPIMVRVRLLYANDYHPVAVKPVGISSLPYQVRVSRSVGTAGSAQRAVQVFQQNNVMPPFLDYVLFSASTVTKN